MRAKRIVGPAVAVLAVAAGCGVPGDVVPYCRDFAVEGIGKVVFRAEQAARAKVTSSAETGRIRVCGVPGGGVEGYHPSDPNWKETPAAEWGLDFKAARFGDVLVVSTENEFRHIHHYYYFDKLWIVKPEELPVRMQSRTLTGNGAVDLGAP